MESEQGSPKNIVKTRSFKPSIRNWAINLGFAGVFLTSILSVFLGWFILSIIELRFKYYTLGLGFAFGGVFAFFFSIWMIKNNELVFISIFDNHLIAKNWITQIIRVLLFTAWGASIFGVAAIASKPWLPSRAITDFPYSEWGNYIITHQGFFLAIFYIIASVIVYFLLIISLLTNSPIFPTKYRYFREWIFPGKKMYFDDIRYVEVEKKNKVFTSTFFPDYRIMVLSLGSTLELKVRNFDKRDSLMEEFLQFEQNKDEIFLKFYYFRGRGSVFARLLRDPSGIFGFSILVLILLVYIWGGIAQFLFPLDTIIRGYNMFLHHPEYQYASDPQFYDQAVDALPSAQFWLGTDFNGRDYFSRLVYGTFFTLNICIMVATLSTLIGSVLGAVAGYLEGWVDQVLTTISDLFVSIPAFALWMIAISFAGDLRFVVGGFYLQTFLIMLIFVWSSPYRIVRSEVKTLKTQEYVAATKVFGAGSFRILFNHIFPNLFPVILVIFITQLVEFLAATITISIIISSETDVIWGSDIARRLNPAFYEQSLSDVYTLFATIWFSITIFGLIMFGDTIKDVLDPRFDSKKKKKASVEETTEEIRVKLEGLRTEREEFVEEQITRHFDNKEDTL